MSINSAFMSYFCRRKSNLWVFSKKLINEGGKRLTRALCTRSRSTATKIGCPAARTLYNGRKKMGEEGDQFTSSQKYISHQTVQGKTLQDYWNRSYCTFSILQAPFLLTPRNLMNKTLLPPCGQEHYCTWRPQEALREEREEVARSLSGYGKRR